VVPRAPLGLADVRRLQALRALGHVELQRLTLGERLEAVALNRGEVDEHVLAAIRLGDETKALRLVEPLHGATSHFETPVVSGSLDPHFAANHAAAASGHLDRSSRLIAAADQQKAARESSGGI